MARTNASLVEGVRYEFREGYRGRKADPECLMEEASQHSGNVKELAEWSKSHEESASWEVAGWDEGVHRMALRQAVHRLQDALGAIRPISAREMSPQEITAAIRRAPPALIAIDGQMIPLDEVKADPEALQIAWDQALGELRGWRRRCGHLMTKRRLREAIEILEDE